MRVCAHCNEEITRVSAGDETLDFCEGCQLIEPETIYEDDEEYEKCHKEVTPNEHLELERKAINRQFNGA